MPTSAQAFEHYILAKDTNRPHLLRRAFTRDASLEMIVHTETISFPPRVEGRDGIAEVLARPALELEPVLNWLQHVSYPCPHQRGKASKTSCTT